MTKREVEDLASKTLAKLFIDYGSKGLLSIYLWGSIITPDFDSKRSDVDGVGILADSADFESFDKIREWLPQVEPKLNRLQINFFYLSELKGGNQRSRLGNLRNAEQAVYDFPFWRHVVGKKFSPEDFPKISIETVLKHQIDLVRVRRKWVTAKVPDPRSGEYYCKSLVWLCYYINKINHHANPLSWSDLQAESNEDNRNLIETLAELKAGGWDENVIRKKLGYLFSEAEQLSKKYLTC